MNTVPVILLGLGKVGRALAGQIVETRGLHAERYGLRLEVVALCDRTGAILEPRGLPDGTLTAIVNGKARGMPLREMEWGYYHGDPGAVVVIAGRSRTVVVDCTASEETVPALLAAQEMGYGVVLANKKPLAGTLELFQSLTKDARTRYEATVGAGLPVVSTLAALVETGDAIATIEGAFSGTLAYLCTELEQGHDFAATVSKAFDLGYTEPDPRDDLGGMDVARKAVILARTLGWPLSLDDVQTESLYPPELSASPVEDFLRDIAALDAPFRERVAKAQARREVLRYAAALRDGQCTVGLRPVPKDSPLGRLQGTDNLIVFRTARYHLSPLVVQGPGAGVEVTAAGVLSDILALARMA